MAGYFSAAEQARNTANYGLQDIGNLPADRLVRGVDIELIGPHQSVDQLASASRTIGYEILTGLGHRYQRTYRGIADRPQRGAPLGDISQ